MKGFQIFILPFLILSLITAAAQPPSLVLQKGHLRKVNSARFSPDGSQMVTTSEDGIIKIWDSFSQKLVSELGGDGILYLDAFFSADGKHIISSAEQRDEGQVSLPGREYSNTPFYVWDIENNRRIYKATDPNQTACISPGNKWIAIHRDKKKVYWDNGNWQAIDDSPIDIYHASSAKVVKSITRYMDSTTNTEPFMTFVSDSLLFIATENEEIHDKHKCYITRYRVLNFFTDTETISFNDTSAVYKSGQWLMGAGCKYFFRYRGQYHSTFDDAKNHEAYTELWDIQQHKLIWNRPVTLQHCSFSKNDSAMLMLYTNDADSADGGPSQKAIRFLLKDTMQAMPLPDRYDVNVVSTNSNGRFYSATAEMGIRHGDTVCIVNIYNNELKVISSVETRIPVSAMTFSPNDKFLVTGHADGNISLWDFKDPLAKEVANSSNMIDPIIQMHTSKTSPKVWYITRGMYGMQDANTINKLSFISSGLATVQDVHYLLKDKYSIVDLGEQYESKGVFLIIDNDTPSIVKEVPFDAAYDTTLIFGNDSNKVEMPGKDKWRIKLNYPGLQSFTVYNTSTDMLNPHRNMFIQTATLTSGILKSTQGTDTAMLISTQGNIQYNDQLRSYVFTYDVPYAIRKAAPKDIVYPVTPRAHNLFFPEPTISDDGRYLLGRNDYGKNADLKFYYCQDLKSNIIFKTPVSFQSEKLGILSKFAISPNKKLACILSDPMFSSEAHFVRVIDAKTGNPLYNLRMNTAGMVNGATYTPDSKYVYTWSEGGTLTKWNLANGRETFTMVFFKDHDYAIILPDGYYFISSRTDAKYLNFKINNKLYNFSQFDLQFNRPDKVLEAIGSKDKSLMDEYYKAWQGRLKKSGFSENDFSASNLHVPAVMVNAGNMQPFTTDRNLPLAFTLTDSLFNIRSYNIFINDVPVNGINGKELTGTSHSANIMQTVLLSEGMNKIEISCTNEKAAVSRKEALYISYAPDKPIAAKTYFIGIGINNYSAHSSFVDLSYCVKDIRDLTAAFKQKYKDNMVIDTLLNESASKENILALKQKLMSTGIDDKVIVSFSGHGMVDPLHPDDFYFVTGNTDVNNPAENGISYAQLEDLLDSIPARKKLLLLDACHSGESDGSANNTSNNIPGAKKGNDANDKNKAGSIEILDVTENSDRSHSSSTDIFKLMKEAFVDIRRNNGAYVLSAAQSNESAGEGGGITNGWFTSCLVAQLQQNATMSINELSTKVNQCVSAKSGGNQNTDNRQELAEFNWVLW